MDYLQYISCLENKFSKYFSIDKNINIQGENIDIFARFNERSGRTFITQKDIIDVFESNELCFIKSYEYLSVDELEKFEIFLKEAVQNFVKPHREHMNTYITGVILSRNDIASEVEEKIKRFKYSKTYKFMLHGWCDVRLIAVSLAQNNVITNKAGKMVKKVYEIIP